MPDRGPSTPGSELPAPGSELPAPSSARSGLYRFLVTGGFVGLIPVAPGTFGSLLAVLMIWGLDMWSGFPWWGPALMALGAAVINVALGRWIPRGFGRQDPGSVVIDEFAGQWIALTVPFRGEHTLLVLGLGFLLFRVFDISKILGIGRAEKLPAGWGVLMDDVVAGIYTWMILMAVGWGAGWLVF